MTDRKYTLLNAAAIDSWNAAGWEWGVPTEHDAFLRAKDGDWQVLLTPTKFVPRDWFPKLAGSRVLGLASGGGQQMPIFTAAGAHCTVMDLSQSQLQSERLVADREGYDIEIVRGDMTEPFPFADESFDWIFHPVSNCYIRDVQHVWNECYRVLKPGGVLLAGLDNGVSFAFEDDTGKLKYRLPFDPLSDERLYRDCIENDWGIQFSHSVEEQVGGQLKAGLRLTDIFQDTDGAGPLHAFNVPTFFATRAVK